MTKPLSEDRSDRARDGGGERAAFRGAAASGEAAEERTVNGRGGRTEDARARRSVLRAQAEAAAATPAARPPQNWVLLSRQVMQASRLCALFILFALVVGWPLGAYISHLKIFGTARGWTDTLTATLDMGVVIFALFVPLLVVMCGYLLSNAYRIVSAAQGIAEAAQQLVQPDATAAGKAKSVGAAVRGEMDALNTGVDGALERLAGVEAIIRHHVTAIEKAGDAVHMRAAGAADKVAVERARLIELTESLNTHADAFAAAIAERAQSGADAIEAADAGAAKAEERMAQRLARLEGVASTALDSFEALTEAIRKADENLRAQTANVEAGAAQARAAGDDAAAAARETAEKLTADIAAIGDAGDAAAAKLASAADGTVEAAREQTRRIAEETAAEAAKNAETVGAAAAAAVETAKTAADGAVAKALGDAEAANAAAEQVAAAATTASDAARKASEDLAETAKAAVAGAEAAADRLAERGSAISKAREALERENERLEKLIAEQQRRADKLAAVIAAQTERLGEIASAAPPPEDAVPPAPVRLVADGDAQKTPPPAAEPRTPPAPRDKDAVSWREILEATESADEINLTQTPPPARPPRTVDVDVEKVIDDLQAFTLSLETRLYGAPPPALSERFDRGDRNVFANRILRLNENDVKRRVRAESARDKTFETSLHQFLQGFEQLLEDATTSETADEELEEYLSSPLGRVYLLIGATVGYFA